MSLRPDALRSGTASGGNRPGQIDYRLARASIVKEYRRGRLSRLDVCDAHPELVRAATNIGKPTGERCPICEEADVVHVSYGFGPRLPASGSTFVDGAELAKLARRAGEVSCYVVEVCPSCRWHHLARTFLAGRRTDR